MCGNCMTLDQDNLADFRSLSTCMIGAPSFGWSAVEWERRLGLIPKDAQKQTEPVADQGFQ